MKRYRAFAKQLGADWVGTETDRPPTPLDRAITFAPSGDVVAINAIHLDRIPQFDYDSLLWGEREMRSIANMTRNDARDFLSLAAEIGIEPSVTPFPFERVNEALDAVKDDSVDGAVVVTME